MFDVGQCKPRIGNRLLLPVIPHQTARVDAIQSEKKTSELSEKYLILCIYRNICETEDKYSLVFPEREKNLCIHYLS